MTCAINTLTDLMTHQREAVEKLMKVRVGALFMEEGTGRTRTAIELVKRRAAFISNVVWFCPWSIRRYIYAEIEKHCGEVADFWHILSMESISKGLKGFMNAFCLIRENSYVIVDESHRIKDPDTKRSNRIIRVASKAYYKLILSGSPITQGIQDLYTQFRFLSERILGYPSYYAFIANHLEFSALNPSVPVLAHNMEHLSAKIEPYIYQKTRIECSALPDRVYKSLHFEMTPEQRDHYRNMKREVLENFFFSDKTIFYLFIRLQQILSGFRKSGKTNVPFKRNPRLELLDDLLKSFPPHSKTVIWAKFRFDLGVLRKLFKRRKALFLAASASPEERASVIEAFQKNADIIVLNERMEKYDLDLNCAERVIFYNSSFSYTNRLRAENLSCGVSSRRKVFFYDILCSSSIDERIFLSLTKKMREALSMRENMRRIIRKKESERQNE